MSTLNSIAVEAYKKYILVSLIHHGQVCFFFYPYTDWAEEKAIKETEANNSQPGYNFWATKLLSLVETNQITSSSFGGSSLPVFLSTLLQLLGEI